MKPPFAYYGVEVLWSNRPIAEPDLFTDLIAEEPA